MPEHIHILLLPPENCEMKAVLQSIKQPVMRRALNYLKKNNPSWIDHLRPMPEAQPHFWQPGGGYDREVVQPETAWSIVDYIHNNPVKRGLVGHPLDWPWSSARSYAGDGEVLLRMDSSPH